MVPEVVGTMGMSSASMGMDQGMWKWGASSLITMFLWSEHPALTFRVDRYQSASIDHPPQDFGAVVVVLHGVLDEAEAVDVTNEGVAVGSQQVEAAHRLLETCPPPQKKPQNRIKKEQC